MTDNFEQAEASRQASVYSGVKPGDPHAEDPEEDPEQHLGAVLRDPWNDPEQKDWADHTVNVPVPSRVTALDEPCAEPGCDVHGNEA